MKVRGMAWLLLAGAMAAPAAWAQTAAGAGTHSPVYDAGPEYVIFSLTPRANPLKKWTLTVDEHGQGTFAWDGQPEAKPREIVVSEETRKVLFAGVPAVQENRCETKVKGIAATGTKVMAWRAGPGTAGCQFNFSDDPALNSAAAAFQAIARTLEFGDELARLHRFDRLGLDAEMEALRQAVQDHFAMELGNIAPVLASIANDDRVMERVRRKAARLLEDAGAGKADPRG